MRLLCLIQLPNQRNWSSWPSQIHQWLIGLSDCIIIANAHTMTNKEHSKTLSGLCVLHCHCILYAIKSWLLYTESTEIPGTTAVYFPSLSFEFDSSFNQAIKIKIWNKEESSNKLHFTSTLIIFYRYIREYSSGFFFFSNQVAMLVSSLLPPKHPLQHQYWQAIPHMVVLQVWIHFLTPTLASS